MSKIKVTGRQNPKKCRISGVHVYLLAAQINLINYNVRKTIQKETKSRSSKGVKGRIQVTLTV